MLNDLPFFKRIQYAYLGMIYAFAYKSGSIRFLGASLRGWIKLLAWAALAATGLWRRELWPLAAALILYIHFTYWHSKRADYAKFVAAETAFPTETNNALPPDTRIPMWATGLFSTAHEENLELLRPAQYWHVPLGEHVIMVEHIPQKYRYQFFTARTLQRVQQGYLMHGRIPLPTLAVTYLVTWRPQSSTSVVNYAMPGAAPPENAPSRVIYFTFATPEEEQKVWQTIVHDAQKARSGEG